MPLTKGKKPTIVHVKNLTADEKLEYIAIGIWWIERKIDALSPKAVKKPSSETGSSN